MSDSKNVNFSKAEEKVYNDIIYNNNNRIVLLLIINIYKCLQLFDIVNYLNNK